MKINMGGTILKELDDLKNIALSLIENVKNMDELSQIKIKLLGKKSELTSLMKSLKDIPAQERPQFGEKINSLQKMIEDKLNDTKEKIYDAEQNLKFKSEAIDITLPGISNDIGNLHPLSIVLNDIEKIFVSMGYEVIPAHDIETTYYNFDALNISQTHPARDEQDTFYINSEQVLVTATSPMQIRVMEKNKPPIKIISPGRVYRTDEIDATHLPMFHQIEGLVVDKNITMSDLKGTLNVFAHELIGENIQTRFRPHYFPFTEPSAEMDVTCFVCSGSGCKTCKHTGFIELLGCGMVHPKVLKNAGIDPDEYSGFAFGMGLERIAMQRFGIEDIRLFYENDLRFINQF